MARRSRNQWSNGRAPAQGGTRHPKNSTNPQQHHHSFAKGVATGAATATILGGGALAIHALGKRGPGHGGMWAIP